ncbi:hypothetical protein FACS189472_08010 [Alphaproteobacteria bacterium]|nr:hypothetical protein FACS189472_08010 [Alphaproteobacteria bacterium]
MKRADKIEMLLRLGVQREEILAYLNDPHTKFSPNEQLLRHLKDLKYTGKMSTNKIESFLNYWEYPKVDKKIAEEIDLEIKEYQQSRNTYIRECISKGYTF